MKPSIPIHPKKRLGQNFLQDKNVLDKLVHYIQPVKTDWFLEVGAGTGELTERIAPLASRFFAVELDDALLPFLQLIPSIEILHQDIRKLDLQTIAPGRKLRVVGNLPYYISTSILTFLIEQRAHLQDLVLLFQEEVTQRILASPSHPEYGFLSVAAQYYCNIEKGFSISRNCFVPKPEIESRVLHFTFHPEVKIEYEEYAAFLKGAFSQKRKKLRNNLLRTVAVPADFLDSVFDKLRISENARAENLSALQYEQLILNLRPI